MRNACTIFIGKPEGRRPFGRPIFRLKRKVNIKRNLNVIGRRVWLRIGADGNTFSSSTKGREFPD
jgi:hypothetical protein